MPDINGTNSPDTIYGTTASEYIYGYDPNTSFGGTATDHDTIYGGGGADWIYAGKGNDTVDVTDSSVGCVIYLGQGDDIFYGGSGGDRIDADSGNDTIYCGAGSDTVILFNGGTDIVHGNGGNDIFQFSTSASGSVWIDGGDGSDSILISATGASIINSFTITPAGAGYSLTSPYGHSIYVEDVEYIRETYQGVTTIRWIEAPGLWDVDPRVGLDGNVDFLNLSDIQVLSIQQHSSYQLYNASDDANIAILPLHGTLLADTHTWDATNAFHANGGNDIVFGNSSDDHLYGDAGNDYLLGNAGDDWLDGGSGDDVIYAGSEDFWTSVGVFTDRDLISGGDGNDTIYVNSSNDIVDGGAGDDIVYSLADFQLTVGVETLVLVGDAVTAIGAGFGETLLGNARANHLNGGAGADRMEGRAGSDVYVVDNFFDVVVEEDSYNGTYLGPAYYGANDTVNASVSYSLSANVEHLVLTGTGDNYGEGNELANYITGNTGNNALIGQAGDDVLQGLAGNDQLIGGAGNDVLMGGAGNDELTGGEGADEFYLGGTPGAGNLDTITDFSVTEDKIFLDAGIYSGFGANGTVLDERFFRIGNVAQDADDRIIYDPVTGKLFYDVDGAGGTAAVLIANLSGGLSLTASNFGFRPDFTAHKADTENVAPNTGNPLLDELIHTSRFAGGTVTYYLSPSDLNGNGTNDWDEIDPVSGVSERTNIATAYAAWSAVAGLQFMEVYSAAQANYVERFGTSSGGAAGSHDYPGGTQGIYSIDTVGTYLYLHETGHGLGLRHPAGMLTSADLNWHLYTLMSYNAGAPDTGWHNEFPLSPMAFDIAAVQAIYGANLAANLGNDVYDLFAANVATGLNRSGYVCIWDAGGVDTIRVPGSAGTASATIDLRAATLSDGPGGGGYLSHVDGGWGGFTIAHGVIIENAVGGAGNDLLIGNDAANRLNGGAGNDRMEGGAGDDVYVVDSASDQVIELLNQGYDTVIANFSYVLGGHVEALVLSGSAGLSATGNSTANMLTGNSGANSLYGLGGNDVLVGAEGVDNMDGGEGSDIYLVNDLSEHAGAEIHDSGAVGVDELRFAATSAQLLTLYAGDTGLERVTIAVGTGSTGNANGTAAIGVDAHLVSNGLEIVGNAGANALTATNFNDLLSGRAGNDTLLGLGGNDYLDGGTGADQMSGGLGNDIFIVDNAGDVVSEGAGQGTDEVRSSVGYTLGANLENLLLTGAANIDGTGNGLANTITGNSGNNALSGLGGNDILKGNAGNDTLTGGAGLDKMYGGTGDDTYVVSDTTDYVFENAGEGTDTVLSSISLTLRPNVENLTLTGVANVFGRGNELGNVITGNNGANKLFGMDGNDVLTGGGGNDRLDGGAGADQLVGGTGNDLYYINDALDTVTELVGQGTDRVYAGISYVLDANIEYLTLTGSANLDATGNNLANFIYGNSGQNILFGLNGDDRIWGWAGNDVLDGGAGTDRMWGGQGDDTYYVHSSTDYTYEYAGEGTDTVYSDVSLILRANVENLILTGSANNYGRGNGEANAITGNSGANKLFGLNGDDLLDGGAGDDLIEGGAGRDVTSGGSGADLFVFGNGDFAGMGEGSADRILDFSQVEGDRLRVSAVDANTNLGGDQAFAFIGADAFHGIAGELRYEAINGNTYVMGDTDGDGNADFWIRLDGLHALNQGDFIL